MSACATSPRPPGSGLSTYQLSFAIGMTTMSGLSLRAAISRSRVSAARPSVDPGALVVAESVQEVEHGPALAHRRRRGGPVQHVGDAAGKRAAWRVEPVFDLAGPRREGG